MIDDYLDEIHRLRKIGRNCEIAAYVMLCIVIAILAAALIFGSWFYLKVSAVAVIAACVPTAGFRRAMRRREQVHEAYMQEIDKRMRGSIDQE